MGTLATDLNPFLAGNGVGFGLPDELGVVANRAIGREFGAAGDIPDGHGGPAATVQEGLLGLGLSIHVTTEVGQNQIGIHSVAKRKFL